MNDLKIIRSEEIEDLLYEVKKMNDYLVCSFVEKKKF